MNEKTKQLILSILDKEKGYIEDGIYRLKDDYPIDEQDLRNRNSKLNEVMQAIREISEI